MKITTAILAIAAIVASLAAAGPSAAVPTASASIASMPAVWRPVTPAAAPTAQKAAAQGSARASAAAGMTAAKTASMNRWYSGATVVQAANVCGDVYRVYSDNVAVNSGSGSSSLEADITSLQTDVATALGNPPPVAADAAIWKTVLNAYSNAAGGPTNSGLVEAARSAKHAAWKWTPPGGPPLVCVNVSI
jgi:hypothetical protein